MRKRRLLPLTACCFLAGLITVPAFGCDAPVAPERCRLFDTYVPEGTVADPSVLLRMGITDPLAPVRSYVLIVDVNFYPNFRPADQRLAPAANDLANLKAFFRQQGFDEIIVLENGDANIENIEYFLKDYLLRSSKAHDQLTRIVFAFSGHGSPGLAGGSPGALVLANAMSGSDPGGTLRLNELQVMLSNLAAESYHFLALIGSCYSGGIFSGAPGEGDNLFFPREPGAHALTSTTADDLAYGLDANSGSIFFDSLIEGVDSGWADPTYAGSVSGPDGGRYIRGGGIARLGSVAAYISEKLDELVNPETGKSFPQIRYGAIQTFKAAGGAFFFKVPPSKTLADLGIAPVATTTGTFNRNDTGSSVVSRPEIKTFDAPDTYSVFGVDISHYSDITDWSRISGAGVSFAYMKATEGGTYQDPTFKENWSGSKSVGIQPGAYHVFNFCRGAAVQFDNITSIVPKDDSALPIAIDLEWGDDGPSIASQTGCNDVSKIREQIKNLNDDLQLYYGKRPILYAHQEGVRELLSDQFNDYALWLQNWSRDGAAGPELSGNNPWTVWQYQGETNLSGVKNADLNVFFGTKAQFETFARTGVNAALQAVLDPVS